MVRRNRVGTDWYGEVWKACVDLGDFLSVRGSLVLTRTGELTVDAQACTVAGKALKPLPDKWHGLQDPEARYRRRYVDLLANPEVREVFRLRARTVRSIRNFSGRSRLSRGGNTGSAAHLRWRGGAALHDPPQSTAPGPVPEDQL